MNSLIQHLETARDNDNLIIVAGNGGSLVNALHFELHLQEKGFRAVSLTNPSILSARSNDFGVSNMFSSSISALGREGDTFIAISGSGTSPNIIQAVRTALARNMFVVGISYSKGSSLLKYSTLPIVIDTLDMGEFEDMVSALSHTLKNSL